jgi:hypothetical protein
VFIQREIPSHRRTPIAVTGCPEAKKKAKKARRSNKGGKAKHHGTRG